MAVAALVVILGAGAVGVGTTLASERTDKKEGFVSELVTAIAEKFDLSESDVQAVFDEQAAARRDEMQAKHEGMIAAHNEKFDEVLAQAVEDGKLTQDQADAITSKRDEIQSYAESLKDETSETRRADMKAKIDELRAWAKDNGIPEQYARFLPPPPQQGRMGGMMGGRMGGGMTGGRGGQPSSGSDAT